MVEPTSCRQCSPGQPKGRAGCLKRARPDLCGGRRVTGVPTANRETSHFTCAPARRRSRERASRSARCSTRRRRTGAVLLSEPDPGVVPLGGGRAGGASRRARCSTRAGERVASLGGGPWVAPLGGGSSSRLASAVLLPGSNCRSQTNGVTPASTVSLSRCSSSRWSPGTTPLGGCRASIRRSASTPRVGAASRWSTSSTAT